MNIITKTFENIDVYFAQTNEDYLMLNATIIAKRFNKQPRDWLKTQETKNYLDAFARKNICPQNCELVTIQQGGNPKEQGTWIHQKLIVAFARWLSSDFAVWCDMTIEEILKPQTQTSQPIQQPQTQTSQKPDFHALTNELNDYEIYSNKLLGFIENLETRKPTTLFRFDKIMLQQFGTSPLETFKINLESQYFLPTELGKMINKSPVEINLILEHKGFQIRENGVWKMTSSGNEFGILIIGKYNQIKWKLKTII